MYQHILALQVTWKSSCTKTTTFVPKHPVLLHLKIMPFPTWAPMLLMLSCFAQLDLFQLWQITWTLRRPTFILFISLFTFITSFFLLWCWVPSLWYIIWGIHHWEILFSESWEFTTIPHFANKQGSSVKKELIFFSSLYFIFCESLFQITIHELRTTRLNCLVRTQPQNSDLFKNF